MKIFFEILAFIIVFIATLVVVSIFFILFVDSPISMLIFAGILCICAIAGFIYVVWTDLFK